MDFLQKTKIWFFNSQLKKELSKQKRYHYSVSLQDAKYIGLLFDATNLETRTDVLSFADKLKKMGKRIGLLGYFDNKLKDPNFTFSHFNKGNIDWAMRPKGAEIQEFANTKFDILISLAIEHQPFFEYIAAISQAKFRVGPITDFQCYDLMIEPRKMDVASLIEQIEYFLQKTLTKNVA